MNFDDEEHRVKRILGDEPNNTPSDTEKKKEDAKQNSNRNIDENIDAHTKHDNSSSVSNDKNSPTSDSASNLNDSDTQNQEILLYDGDISQDNIPNDENTENDIESKSLDNSEAERNSETDGNSEPDDKADNKAENTSKDQEKADKENPKKDKAEKDKAEKDKAEKDKAEKDKTAESKEDEEKFISPSEALKKEKALKKTIEEPMGLLDHLSELRRRLTRIVIMLLIGFFAFYGVSELAYSYLALPLTEQLPEGSTLIYTSPQGAFFTYLKVSLMLSIIGTSPFTFYQIWAFIAPGLYKEEQSAVAPLAFFSTLFFVSGAAFCYFMVFPIAFKFFLGFTSDVVIPMISVEEYLSFALKLIIAFGLVFEMPLFSYFLAKLRIISPEGMRKHRKYAVLAIFIIAAILTPPDVFSQVLMALPMLVLYEISIHVAKVARGKAKPVKIEDETEESLADKINNFK